MVLDSCIRRSSIDDYQISWHKTSRVSAWIPVASWIFGVIAALQGPPQQSAKYANLIGVIIVYKWSSENRFFSTKLSLGCK